MNFWFRIAFCVAILWLMISKSMHSQRIIPLHFPEKFSKRVSSVIQDRDNFLWIGTSFGLYKYDSERITKFFNSNSSKSIPDDNVLCLEEDNNSNIWIGTEGGLAVYNKFQDTTLKPGNWIKGLNQSITTIKYDKNTNKTFICNNNGEIFIISQNPELVIQKIKLHGKTTRENYISEILFDKLNLNKIWVSTHSGLLEISLNNKGITRHKNLSKNDPDDISRNLMLNCLLNDTINKQIWVGSWGGGLMKFDVLTGNWNNYYFHKNTQSSTKNIVLKIDYYSENEILVCSPDSGLLVFNIQTEQFKSLKNKYFADVTLDMGECITFSKGNDGYWWIGYQKGLSYISKKSGLFQNHDLPQLKGCVSSICSYSNNEIMMGNIYENNEIIIWNLDNQTITKRIKCAPSKSFIKKIFRFKDKFYYLSGGCIYEIDEINCITKKVVFQQNLSQIDGKIRDLTPHDNLLFIVDNDNLFYSLSNNFKLNTTFYSYANSKQNDLVNQIYLDGRNLIFSTKNKLGVLDLKTDRYYMVIGQFHDSYKPEGITRDRSGKVWCGSKGSAGLICFEFLNDTLKWRKNYNTEFGINSHNIWDLAPDGNNSLWFLSDNGVYYFDYQSEMVKNYGSDFGLPTHKTEMIMHSINDSVMIIGSCGFLSVFNKKNALKFPQNTRPRLTNMKVIGAENKFNIIPKEDSIYLLKHYENQIEFEFTAFNFGENNNQTYYYRLEGLDNFINKADRQNSVHYSNLAAGNYKFCVSTHTKSELELSPNQYCVRFTIYPPFWQTIYFYILIFILVLASIILIFYLKINQVKKKQIKIGEQNKFIAELEMRALKAQMNPHFIFNCLNSINRYIVKNEPEKASDYLAKFSKLIRFMLDQSSLAEIPLSREIDTLKLYMEMEALRFDQKFEFKIHIGHQIQTDSILIPPMLVQPYVENAIWHGLMQKKDKGFLLIDITNQEKLLCISITDNGIGRKKAMEYKSKSEKTKKSYGMTLNQERLRIFQSTYNKTAHAEIIDLFDETSQASGTRVILKFEYKSHESNHY